MLMNIQKFKKVVLGYIKGTKIKYEVRIPKYRNEVRNLLSDIYENPGNGPKSPYFGQKYAIFYPKTGEKSIKQ